MYFLTDPLVNLALEHFDELQPTDPPREDKFFNTFSPGNRLFYKEKPFERFCDYEELLSLIQRRDSRKYELIHKGTLFSF